MFRGIIAVSALTLVAACDSRTCGDGTLRYGDKCVLDDPFDKTAPSLTVDPPRYTREVGTVRLTSDEPATIYYTIDGQSPTLDSAHEDDQVVIGGVPDNSELRFFAVDRNGNRSAEELRVWIIDREGPAAPLDFVLSFSNPQRTVQWTPPPDPRPGGVLVARVEGLISSPPLSGRAYNVGDELSPGVTIVAMSAAELTTMQTFSESKSASPGLIRYAAWAYDDLLNYGPPAGDYEIIPTPPQTAIVTVSAATGIVTVTAPAMNTTLSGTAVFTAGTGTLSAELTMRNDTTRVMYAPKMVLTSALPGGITWTDNSGTIGTMPGTPYRAYGAAIAPGTTQTATWTFTGATVATTLSLTVDIKNGPVMMAGAWDYDLESGGSIVDAELGGELIKLSAAPAGQGGGSMTTTGGITPDGRVIVGARTSGTISSFDIQTGARLVTTTLRQQKAFTPRVILDPSGSAVYALVANGHPYNIYQSGSSGASTTDTELVRLDASTLTVSGRLPLGNTRTRNLDISPDGRTLVIASGITARGVFVIDLASFTIKTSIVTDFKPQVVLYAPALEGSPSIVIIGETAAVYTVDGVKVSEHLVGGTEGKVLGAALDPAGKLWVARSNEIVTVDLTTGATAVVPALDGWSIAIYDGQIYVHGTVNNTVDLVDATGAVTKTLTGFYTIDGHWLGRSPF